MPINACLHSFGLLKYPFFLIFLGIESSYNGFYDIPPKVQENILDLLSTSTTKKNGFIDRSIQQQRVLSIPTTTTSTNKPLVAPPNTHVQHNNVIFDSLDENMSKFFMNFHKNLKGMNSTTTAPSLGQQPQQQSEFTNGFNGIHHNSFYTSFANPADRLVVLQQKQMEEQFLNLGLKQGKSHCLLVITKNSIEDLLTRLRLFLIRIDNQ